MHMQSSSAHRPQSLKSVLKEMLRQRRLSAAATCQYWHFAFSDAVDVFFQQQIMHLHQNAYVSMHAYVCLYVCEKACMLHINAPPLRLCGRAFVLVITYTYACMYICMYVYVCAHTSGGACGTLRCD